MISCNQEVSANGHTISWLTRAFEYLKPTTSLNKGKKIRRFAFINKLMRNKII